MDTVHKKLFISGMTAIVSILSLTPMAANLMGSAPAVSPVSIPAATVPAPAVTPVSIPAATVTAAAPVPATAPGIQYKDPGILEDFDEAGRRTGKARIDENGEILERWLFDAEKGRIVRYEKFDREKNGNLTKRITTWAYDDAGGFVKTSEVRDGRDKFLYSFREEGTATGIRFRQDWYDQDAKLIAQKTWDPESGAFTGHVRLEYLFGGLKRLTFLDEKGQKVRQVIETAKGKELAFGGLKEPAPSRKLSGRRKGELVARATS